LLAGHFWRCPAREEVGTGIRLAGLRRPAAEGTKQERAEEEEAEEETAEEEEEKEDEEEGVGEGGGEEEAAEEAGEEDGGVHDVLQPARAMVTRVFSRAETISVYLAISVPVD
jgi:hypothetical protein